MESRFAQLLKQKQRASQQGTTRSDLDNDAKKAEGEVAHSQVVEEPANAVPVPSPSPLPPPVPHVIDYSGRTQHQEESGNNLSAADIDNGSSGNNNGEEDDGDNDMVGGSGGSCSGGVLRKTWTQSWVLEQYRRAEFEKRLQANEAWWPAALAVMDEAQDQNKLLVKSLERRLQLEAAVAEGLSDIALAMGLTPSASKKALQSSEDDHRIVKDGKMQSARGKETSTNVTDDSSGSSSSSSSSRGDGSGKGASKQSNGDDRNHINFKDKEHGKKKEGAGSGVSSSHSNNEHLVKARIAATAATAATAAELTPGRVLALLGADAASEALRRNRAAATSNRILIEDRLNPMVIEFGDVMRTTEKSGQDLMAYGRETHKAVRAAFDRYDRQARLLLKLIEEDDEASAEAAQGAAHSAAVAAVGFSRPSPSTSVAVSAFRIATALATAASSTSEASSASSSTVCADSDTLNAAAMRAQSSSRGSGGDGLALIDPLEEDVWLQALRWRLAATWQKTLWHDSTRRYRQHYESLLGIEHNRRVVWASTLQAWEACIVKSFGESMPDSAAPYVAPFSASVGRTISEAAESSANTHVELTEAIKKRVSVGLMDLASAMGKDQAFLNASLQSASEATTDGTTGNGLISSGSIESISDSTKESSSSLPSSETVSLGEFVSIEDNPLVVKSEILELKVGSLILTSWVPVVAIVTVQGNLFLFKASRIAMENATRRCHQRAESRNSAASSASSRLQPTASDVFGEIIRQQNPIIAPLAPGSTRAAQAAHRARVEALTKSQNKGKNLPQLPTPLEPHAAVVVANVESVRSSSSSQSASMNGESSGSHGSEHDAMSRPTSSSSATVASIGSGRGVGHRPAFDFVERIPNQGLVSYVQPYTARTFTLRCNSPACCFDWVALLQRLSGH